MQTEILVYKVSTLPVCFKTVFPFVLAVLTCLFFGNNQFSDDVKTALQQIKDELTEIKQEMKEEHTTTRNTSIQGKHDRSFVVLTVTEPRGKSKSQKDHNAI